MRQLQDDEGEAIVTIPLIVRVVDIRIQPLTIIIAVGIEQVRIAVGIVRNIVRSTALRI